MGSYYSKLVKDLGEDGAKEYMRSLRAKVTTKTGFAVNPEKARQAQAKSVRVRLENKQNEKISPEEKKQDPNSQA